MDLCFDVYAWTRTRDRSTLTLFVESFVDRARGTGMMQDQVEVAPVDLAREVPRQFWEHRSEWDTMRVDSVEDVIRLGLEQPYRVFCLCLYARAPWASAMLNFTLDGGVVFGVSVEDAGDTSRLQAEELAASMLGQFGAERAWVVYEEPGPDDPLAEEPWRSALFSAG